MINTTYSPVRMKFNNNNVSLNFSGYTKTIKDAIYFRKPYKMVTKNAKKNGCGRLEIEDTPTHYVSIFYEI